MQLSGRTFRAWVVTAINFWLAESFTAQDPELISQHVFGATLEVSFFEWSRLHLLTRIMNVYNYSWHSLCHSYDEMDCFKATATLKAMKSASLPGHAQSYPHRTIFSASHIAQEEIESCTTSLPLLATMWNRNLSHASGDL